jgi:hippurate hydrolase
MCAHEVTSNPHLTIYIKVPMLFDYVLPGIQEQDEEMRRLRRKLHANPELGFEEHATSELVASMLTGWGFEVHRGLGGTGVVGTLANGSGTRIIGMRADMDALPITEETALPHASAVPGKMHACGHDGHTAMLLSAARYLATHRSFSGTVRVIFQPAEEGYGGARKMIDDGLFELFPCDAVFAAHNMPGLPLGKLGFRQGPFMASSDTVIIKINGRGGHGSLPSTAVDPVLVGSHIVVALQSIVSRNTDPRKLAVITAGAFNAGDAPNVIPDTAQIRLSVRAHEPAVRENLRKRIVELVEAQATAFGATTEIEYRWRYPVLVNDEAMTRFAEDVARDWCGEEGLIQNLSPLTGSEDFAFMLEECPGSYWLIGAGENACMVHHPKYDFNDELIGVGASFWVKLAEQFCS